MVSIFVIFIILLVGSVALAVGFAADNAIVMWAGGILAFAGIVPMFFGKEVPEGEIKK